MSQKISGCPWCRCPPEIIYKPAGGGGVMFIIACKHPWCRVNPKTEEFDNPVEAVLYWNKWQSNKGLDEQEIEITKADEAF